MNLRTKIVLRKKKKLINLFLFLKNCLLFFREINVVLPLQIFLEIRRKEACSPCITSAGVEILEFYSQKFREINLSQMNQIFGQY